MHVDDPPVLYSPGWHVVVVGEPSQDDPAGQVSQKFWPVEVSKYWPGWQDCAEVWFDNKYVDNNNSDVDFLENTVVIDAFDLHVLTLEFSDFVLDFIIFSKSKISLDLYLELFIF